jgi:CubicO group peptidase (beta-lactamase class C family)
MQQRNQLQAYARLAASLLAVLTLAATNPIESAATSTLPIRQVEQEAKTFLPLISNASGSPVAPPPPPQPTATTPVPTPSTTPVSPTLDVVAARDFLNTIGSNGMLVMYEGRIVYEAYLRGYDGTTPKPIASGTKSFSCALVAAAEADGLLRLDELAADALPQWTPGGSAPQSSAKAKIRVRDLLSLSAGLANDGAAGGGLNTVDSYQQAINAPSRFEPGVAAIYTPNSFQALAASFERKTGGQFDAQGVLSGGRDPLVYLTQRVFDPMGLKVGDWQRDINGKPNFGGGAALTAREWAKYGELMRTDGVFDGKRIMPAGLLQRCITYHNAAFLGYGLSWWLNRDVGTSYQPQQDSVDVVQALDWQRGGRFAPSAPDDMYMAAGFGGYRLYVIPSRSVVAVRMGGREPRDPAISADDRFIGLLLGTQTR